MSCASSPSCPARLFGLQEKLRWIPLVEGNMGRTCLLRIERLPDVRQQVSWLTRLVLDEVRYLSCEPLVLKHLCSSRTLFGIGSQAG